MGILRGCSVASFLPADLRGEATPRCFLFPDPASSFSVHPLNVILVLPVFEHLQCASKWAEYMLELITRLWGQGWSVSLSSCKSYLLRGKWGGKRECGTAGRQGLQDWQGMAHPRKQWSARRHETIWRKVEPPKSERGSERVSTCGYLTSGPQERGSGTSLTIWPSSSHRKPWRL